MKLSASRILGNVLALALAVGIAGLAACGGGGGSVTTLMGGAIQGAPLSLASASAVVSTLAGSAVAAPATLDGTGTAATFNIPAGTTTDGTNLYVTEGCSNNNTNGDIRKIEIATGVVTTLAGSITASGFADGVGTAATFNCPWGITTDGNALYVADYYNNKIRKIAPSSGTLSAMTSANAVVTSLTGPANAAVTGGAADGTGTAASFNGPNYITTDGINLYVTDYNSNKIRKIAPSSGTLSAMTSANAVVTSLTGPANAAVTGGAADGAGTTATFNNPNGITTDGNALYVTDLLNNKIRIISPTGGTLSTMTSANAVVRSVTGAASAVMPVGAQDGAGTTATFNSPYGITTDGSSLYVTEWLNNKIRMVTPSGGTLSTMTSANAVVSSVTGTANTTMGFGHQDGAAAAATFNAPSDVTSDGSSLYVVGYNNYNIRKLH